MLTLLLPLLAWADVDPDLNRRVEVEALIQRAEISPIGEQEEKIPRVERDVDGKVKRLRLDGFELSPQEFQALARIPSLRTISFQRTNLTDRDLAHLRSLPNLAGLNLNHTKITDAAIDHLKSMPALRSLCLMGVCLSREAVDDLRASRRGLGIGFHPLR